MTVWVQCPSALLENWLFTFWVIKFIFGLFLKKSSVGWNTNMKKGEYSTSKTKYMWNTDSKQVLRGKVEKHSGKRVK